jgi:hypothetical protein
VKDILIHVLISSFSKLEQLSYKELLEHKKYIRSIYNNVKSVCNLISLLGCAYIVFSVSPYAKEAMSSVMYHTINPILVFTTFVILNICIYTKYRITRSYKLISSIISNSSSADYLKMIPSNDQSWSDNTVIRQPQKDRTAA